MATSIPARQPQTQSEEELANLLAEVAGKLQAGESVDLSEYVARHPEHAERLQQLLPAMKTLAQLRDSRSGVPVSAAGPAGAGVEVHGALGDFRILREIGRGGMGIVYEAEQISLGRRVALKVLPLAGVLDERQLTRFRNEARAAASLDHPNVVHVYSIGCERGVHYYAMEYIDGRTLAEVIEELREEQPTRRGQAAANGTESTKSFITPPYPVPASSSPSPLSPSSPLRSSRAAAKTPSAPDFFRMVAQWGIQAAEGLEHAHRLSVIHRDVKPSNLMVGFQVSPRPLDGRGAGGEGDQGIHLRITDFGLAMVETGENLTMTGDILGTLRYMSPEQAQGDRGVLDHRTDIYSLGVTLYELTTLAPPFAAASRHELIHQISDSQPRAPRQLNPAIPRDLETIVLRAMSAEPAARYASARKMADDLRRFLEHKPITARRPSLPERGAKWLWRHRPLVMSAVALLFLATVSLAVSTVLIAQARRDAVEAYEEKDEQLKATKRAEELARKQEHLAKEQERLAKEQHRLADAQKEEAIKQRDIAERNLYIAHMRAAQRDWELGQIRRLHDILDSHVPAPGRPDLRGWEWYYLLSLCHSDLMTLRGHRGSVNRVTWSPDGKLIASGGADKAIKIWDAATGRELRTIAGHQGGILSLAWSPDGKRLASGSADGTARVWDSATGKEGFRFRVPAVPADVLVYSVAWNPDGRRLAIGGSGGYAVKKTPSEDPRLARVWDVSTGREILNLDGEARDPVAWSADGKRLATGGRGWWEFRTWDATTGRRLLVVAHDVSYGIAWSLDGKRLATAGAPNEARILEATTGRNLLDLRHPGVVSAVAWSSDGHRLATATQGQRVTVWNTSTGEEILRLQGHRGKVNSVAWNPDCTRLVSAGDDGTIKIWDATHAQGPMVLDRVGATDLAWSPTGDRLASAAKGKIKVWNSATGAQRKSFDMPAENVTWSPDGTRLAVSIRGIRTVILNLETGKRFDAPGADVFASWSRDGRHLAIAQFGSNSVHVWDTQRRRDVVVRHGPAEYQVTAAAWSPDGSRIASGALAARTAVIWDAATGKDLLTLFEGHSVWCLAWHPDGKRLATGHGPGMITLWDTTSGLRLLTLVGHTGKINVVGFSPDGKRLASASVDGSVRIWDPDSGQDLFSVPGTWVAWSPDGRRLATVVDPEGTIRIYDASIGYALSGADGHKAARTSRMSEK